MANASRDSNRIATLLGVSSSDFVTPTTIAVDASTHAVLISGSITASNPSVGTNATTAPTSSTEIGWIDGSGNLQGVSASNPLPVSASFSPSGTQDVNLTKVAGASIATGHGTASGAIRVELPTDGTGLVTVAQATAASLNATVVGTGIFVVQAALSAGTNVIGDIRNITTNIVPGVATTSLGKAEDAAHSSGDTGVMALGVRNDAGAVLAGSDGDYIPITTDSTGALRIDMNGTVSTNNSSTATLTGNSVFTGASDDSLIYNEIRVSVFADQASATDGLSIQQSQNNTNWDITDVYTIAASTGSTFAVPRQARYVRIVYTNGSVGQGAFRLQTILNRTGTMASSQRPSDGYTNQTDLEQTQAFGMIYNNSTWDRVREVVNATDSTGTGIAAIGNLAQFDDVSPGTVTENRFGNLRMSVRRELYSQIRDAAGNERGVNVDANGGIPITIESAQTLATVTTVSTVTNLSQMGGVAIALNSGAVSTGTQRVVLPNDTGRTLVSKGGSASSSGDNTLVVAGTNRLKVYAFSLSTVSTTAVTCIFQSGASGTELWRVILQTPASVAGGANLVVQPPAWIFATAAATLLNLNLSAAVAVNWSVAYYDEA